MRVLHYVDENNLTWRESWIALLLKLTELGVDNRALCRGGGTLAARLREGGFETAEYRPLFPSAPALCRGAAKRFDEAAPDIIHTRLSSAAAIGGLWGRRGNVPVVSTVDKHAKIKYYRNADMILPCSEAVARHMEAQGFPPERSRVVYNPIDARFYKRDERARREMRAKNSTGEGDVVIAAGGRFDDGKGFGALIEGYALFLKGTGRGAGTKLWLIGDGPLRAEMEGAVSRLGAAGSVLFSGYVDDVREWLWGADVFVSPSERPEGFSVMLLEAMACGLPAIATNIGGSPEIVTEGVNGLLYEPGDASALAERFARIFSLRAKLPQLRAEAERSAAQFGLDAVAERTIDIYERLLSRKNKR